MSNEKPVELTESEKADLIDAFQDGYLMSTDPLTSDLTQLGIVVTRIKAAARREALLEAAEEAAKQAEWIEMMRGQKAALAAKLAQTEDDLAAALAGIERDEEGGR